MAKTPPAPNKPSNVFSLPRSRRADETVSFETEKRPDSHTEIVVGDPPRRDDDTERTTLVDPPTDRHDPAAVRRGPPSLPMSREPDLRLPTRTFAKDELVADFFVHIDEVMLIKRGRLTLEALDHRGEIPLKDFRIEVGPGQLLFEELLTAHGKDGIVSDFRVTAKETTEVYVLTLDDLVDAPDQVTFRARLYAVLNATTDASSRTRRLQVLHREQEDAMLAALDAARAQTHEYEVECGRLRQRAGSLEELNRRLTHDVVNKVVLEELKKLGAQVRELLEKNRTLERVVLERTSETQSALSYAETVTEELVKLEKLRDLLDLQTADRKMFLSEVQRTFLTLLYTEDVELQQLAVNGLGVLSDLSHRKSPSSIAPTDPTKNPPRGG